MADDPKLSEEIEVRLSGAGGQGLQLSAHILAHALIADGRRIAQSQSYEPTSRGGLSRSDLVISDDAVDYPLVTALDFLIVLDQIAVDASRGLIKPGALVLTDADRVPAPPEGDFTVLAIPFFATAQALGDARAANMVALSALVAVSDICRRESLLEAVRGNIPEKLLELNTDALGAGYRLVEGIEDPVVERAS